MIEAILVYALGAGICFALGTWHNRWLTKKARKRER